MSKAIKSKTIAIVDDDEAVREATGALLASVGYGVSAYESGPAFLDAARQAMPDCVVLDHQMRGVTGVEIAEGLAAARARTSVIMISGNLSDAVRARAENAGVAAILEKPFSDDALIAAIEKAIGGAG